jgi:UPF0755 protein
VKKLATVVVLLLVLGIGGSQAYSWVDYQLGTPVAGRSEPVSVKVTQGESPDDIAADLKSKNLIRDVEVFNLYVRFTGDRTRFQAGDYVLNRDMSARQIADALQHGHSDQLSITIPEGYTAAKTAELVAQSKLGTAAQYLAAEKETSWSYDFLSNRPARDLEGYLFPDTYSLNKDSTPHDLVKVQLDRFGQVFTTDLRGQAGQATAARPAESIDSIVILASMVERETNRDADRGKACSVYYNRLKQGMPLQVDATVLYALGVWKKDVTFDDLKVASPYNTYLHAGLPPGPIANPGAAAIKACVSPEQTNFIFYFTDKQGVTHFEATQAQFEADKQKYGVSGS